VPYRDNVSALVRLGARGRVSSSCAIWPATVRCPNYLLHESAHAVAFHELFGRPKASVALAAQGSLLGIGSAKRTR
jgi:hypothetical protein